MTKSLTHIVIAAVFLLLTLGAFVFWFMAVEHARTAVAQTAANITAKSEEAKRIRDAQGALAALSQNEARIKSYFISKGDIGSFLEVIGSTGDPLGADVEIVSVTEEGSTEGHPRVSLALSITGSFDGVMRTVGAIEYGPYDVVLKNLSISAGTGTETKNTWIAVATYSFGAQTP